MVKKLSIAILIILFSSYSYANNFDEEILFLENFTEKAISIIASEDLSKEEKENLIARHVIKYSDMDKISQAVLGSKTWSTTTIDQKERFFKLFQEYVSKRYTKYLTQYVDKRTKINIEEATNFGKNNRYIKISSTVYNEDNQGITVKINWYLLNGEELKLFNVEFEGAHMIIIFREQIKSILSKNSDFELFLKKFESL